MTHENVSSTILIPPEVVQEALLQQAEPRTLEAPKDEFLWFESVPQEQAPDDTSQQNNKARGLAIMATGAAATGHALFSGSGEAHAASTEVAAQPPTSGQEQNPAFMGTLIIGAIGVVATTTVAGVSRWVQSRETASKAFNEAVKEIGSIDDEGRIRVLPITAVGSYTTLKRFRSPVHKVMAAYLRDRRGDLGELRKKYTNEGVLDQASYDHAVANRRYADREAFHIFVETLPNARKKLQGPGIKERAKRLAGKDEIYEIQKQTDTLPQKEDPRVPLAGLNFDQMRGIDAVDLSQMDFSGAGFQEDSFTNVSFRAARLVEAQLEGSALEACSLIGTDARAAYWSGATIARCLVDKNTKMGNLPRNHTKAKYGVLKPDQPDEFRGDARVILKDLIPAKGMSQQELKTLIKEWKQNGLVLLEGSNPEYMDL